MAEIILVDTKVCSVCKRALPLERFWKNKHNTTGIHFRCKGCERVYRDNRKEQSFKDVPTEHELKHTFKVCSLCKRNKSLGQYWLLYNDSSLRRAQCGTCSRFMRARLKSKNRGRPFALSISDWCHITDQPCTYCGLSSTGADRIDNSLGYTLDNILPACGECNRVRGDFFSVEEMKLQIGPVIRAVLVARESK